MNDNASTNKIRITLLKLGVFLLKDLLRKKLVEKKANVLLFARIKERMVAKLLPSKDREIC